MTPAARGTNVKDDGLMTFDRYARAIVAWRDPQNVGAQLVCSVDDAWLFPGVVAIERLAGTSEVSESAIDETWFTSPSTQTIDNWAGDVRECKLEDLKSHLDRRAKPNAARSKVSTDDIFFALDLIAFCAKHNYGLCLCSFEAFYRNVVNLNCESNAVLLDLNHALLSDSSNHRELLRAWNAAEPELFDPWDGPTILGWYLYYHLKLAAESQERWPRSRLQIDPRHLMIVSSKPEVGMDVFRLLPRAVAIADRNGKSLADCGYFLMPKTSQKNPANPGVDFQLVSSVFNNSFRHAASFKKKKKAILRGMKRVWLEDDFAHPDGEAQVRAILGKVDWAPWIETRGVSWQVLDGELRSLFRPKWKRSAVMRGSTFWGILQHLAPGTADRVYLHRLENLAGVTLWPALYPGAFLLLGLAGLIEGLADGSCKIEMFCFESELRLRIGAGTEPSSWLVELWKKSLTGAGGASAALRDVLSGSPRLFSELLKLWKDETERNRIISDLCSARHCGMNMSLQCQFESEGAVVITVGYLNSHGAPTGE